MIVPDMYPYKATRRLIKTSSIYLAGELSFLNRINQNAYVAPTITFPGILIMSVKVKTNLQKLTKTLK